MKTSFILIYQNINFLPVDQTKPEYLSHIHIIITSYNNIFSDGNRQRFISISINLKF